MPPNVPAKGYIKKYLEDPAVAEWNATLRLRSESTARAYLDNMARVWQSLGVSPQEFVDRDQAELDQLGQRVLNSLHAHRQENGERLSEGYLKLYRAAMRSWVQWHGRAFQRPLVVGRAPVRPHARRYFIPDRQQLRTVLNLAAPRTRASIALIAFAGLRPEVQGSEEGDRGLVLGDITGIKWEKGRLAVDALPLRIDVGNDMSKNGRCYYSHLGAEGAEYLLAYLNGRIAGGETLTPRSAVFSHLKGGTGPASKKFLRTQSLCNRIKKVHHKAGLAVPPYIWRSYFDANMMLAESRGLIIRDYRQFLMGHAGDVEAVYTVRKKLPEETGRDMAERYMAALKHLETQAETAEEDAAEAVITAFLRGLQVPEDEIGAIDFKGEPARIEAVIQTRVGALLQAQAPAPASAVVVAGSSEPMQRLVDVGAVGQWLESGWTWAYNAPVPPGKALLEAPPGSAVGAHGGPVAA